VVLALTAVGLSGTASASVSSLTLDSKAQLSASKTDAVATGTIVCTAGDSVDISVVIPADLGEQEMAQEAKSETG
jgi:hypothetical protein